MIPFTMGDEDEIAYLKIAKKQKVEIAIISRSVRVYDGRCTPR